jgi:glycine/D-amino acid oxidase-like deaminating enzyme
VRIATRISGLYREGRNARGVELADGEIVKGDCVVNCLGPWINTIAPEGAKVPLAPKLGLTVATLSSPTFVNRVVKGPHCYARPTSSLPPGVMLHSKAADATLTDETKAAPDLPGVLGLLAQGADMLPGLSDVGVAEVRLMTRAFPIDDHPIIGPVETLPGYYVAVTHSGIILAPLVGELVVQDLLNNFETADLSPYRPQRFDAAP